MLPTDYSEQAMQHTTSQASEGSSAQTAGNRPRYLPLVAVIMLAIAAVDQAVKQLMLGWLTPGEPVAVLSLIHISEPTRRPG